MSETCEDIIDNLLKSGENITDEIYNKVAELTAKIADQQVLIEQLVEACEVATGGNDFVNCLYREELSKINSALTAAKKMKGDKENE